MSIEFLHAYMRKNYEVYNEYNYLTPHVTLSFFIFYGNAEYFLGHSPFQYTLFIYLFIFYYF